MSKQALYYYAENLPLVQRATFTNSGGKEYGLGENGRDLLVFLCNAANEKHGWTFYFSYQFIAQETFIHISTVKRLMAGLEQLGWITRTGQLIRHQGRGAPQVEFCLTFYPPALELMRTGRPTSRPTSRPGATDNLAEPLQTLSAQEKLQTETEPEPETEPQPERHSGGTEPGKEGGISIDEVLRGCLEWERSHFTGIDKGGLAKTWEKDYRQIIPTVLAGLKDCSTDEAVNMCVTQRNADRGLSLPSARHKTAPATTVRLLPDFPDNADPACPMCKGKGYYPDRPVGNGRDSWCLCAGGTCTATPEPTTERVNTGEGANTDLPSPGDTADPQSAIRELTKKLRLSS